LINMGECFNAVCGFDADHEHGEECTTDCPCGLGVHDLAGNPIE